jgi:adenosylmethionine-8-amino-7-oxononanoate aminotransferase
MKIETIHNKHLKFKNKIEKHSKVRSARVLGVIFALDLQIKMKRYGNLRDKLFEYFMENGVFLRPLGNTIYILAPYTITMDELDKIYTVIEKSLEIV